MANKRNRKKRNAQAGTPYYWQTDEYNAMCYNINVDMLLSIAVNRFRWVGLPSTCDPRFLEIQLHKTGLATICHREDMPDIWQTLMAAPQGTFNDYGLPVRWLAKGFNETQYQVTPANGELVYYSQTRLDPWGAIVQYATKLAHIQRTFDVNLMHQQKPYVMVAPEEQRQVLVNIYKQISGFEPAILGNDSIKDILNEENTFAIDTKVPYIGAELAESYQNCLNDYLLFMGVPHQTFEKQERLTKEEALQGSICTNIILKNCLDSRRWACDKLRELDPEAFADTYVYLNDDYESYNFNMVNNLQSLAESSIVNEESKGLTGKVDEIIEDVSDNGTA